VPCACVVQFSMIPFSGTSAVEAMEADIQARRIVLTAVSHSDSMLEQSRYLTIESKH
jgi:hypothetical protein